MGKLKVREAVNVLGTEAEKDLLAPAVPFYADLAKMMVEKQMSVDLFLGAAQYTDVATLSSLVQTLADSSSTTPPSRATRRAPRRCTATSTTC